MAFSSSGVLRDNSGKEHSRDNAEKGVNTQAEVKSLLAHPDNTQSAYYLENPSSPSTFPLTFTDLLEMSPSVAGASSFSSPRDYNRSPYTEVEYTPKRFRPKEHEKEHSGDTETDRTGPSMSNTWMPTEDADEQETELDSPVSPEKVLCYYQLEFLQC